LLKVKGYAAAKKKGDAKGEDDMKDVCNDYCLALKYDFAAIQDYDTIDHIDPYHKDGKEWPLYINSDLDFDDESIMLYTPAEYANEDADTDDVLQVPLAFWKDRGVGYEPPEMIGEDELEIIEPKWEISDGDVEGVQYLYPWED